MFYAAGPAKESFWKGTATGFSYEKNVTPINGVYSPVVGDFNGDGKADILFYGPNATDSLWRGAATSFTFLKNIPQITGSYTPVVGNFDASLASDVLFYRPGPAAEVLWRGLSSTAGFVANSTSVQSSSFVPVAADFNGDGRTDVLWNTPNSSGLELCKASGSGFLRVAAPALSASNTAIEGDFNADGRADVLWYRSGSGSVRLWRGIA